MFKITIALAGVAQLAEFRPVHRVVASWIPGQGTWLVYGYSPWAGQWVGVDWSMFLSLPFSLIL